MNVNAMTRHAVLAFALAVAAGLALLVAVG